MVEGLPVHGYVDQSVNAIDTVNNNKIVEEHILRMLDLMAVAGNQFDQRFVSIARTQFQMAFMAMNRAVFRPERLMGNLPDIVAEPADDPSKYYSSEPRVGLTGAGGRSE